MSEEGPTGKAVEVVKTVVELASDSPELADAGKSFAKSAQTIAKAVENALLPIAAMNYGFERARTYFEEKFRRDMEEVTKDIPLDEIVEPKPTVAGPALSGLALSHEEPDLKSMYLHLLRTAMDGRIAESAHPAFAEVIRQFGTLDAQIFCTFRKGTVYPIVTLGRDLEDGYVVKRKNVFNFMRGEQPLDSSYVEAAIDNCERLGLLSIRYDQHLTATGRYDWVETRPEYRELVEAGHKVMVSKGTLELTAFGQAFLQAVS